MNDQSNGALKPTKMVRCFGLDTELIHELNCSIASSGGKPDRVRDARYKTIPLGRKASRHQLIEGYTLQELAPMIQYLQK